MIKRIKRIKKTTSNRGSGLVLVVVALSFLGILMGTLLTLASYLYKIQVYEYSQRDNYNYLEQAMDQVYQNIGNMSTEYIQAAYVQTLQEMSSFDSTTQTYRLGDEAAVNAKFKDLFMQKLIQSDALNYTNLGKRFTEIVSSSTQNYDGTLTSRINIFKEQNIALNINSLKVMLHYIDGSSEIYTSAKKTKYNYKNVTKIVIRNVELTRQASYDRSLDSKGNYKQTISTDIVINRPAFNVNFDQSSLSAETLFSFCIIADSGLEINKVGYDASVKNAENPNVNGDYSLTIAGNVYAASDFYNKGYNAYDVTDKSSAEYKDYIKEMSFTNSDDKYKMIPITKKYDINNPAALLHNQHSVIMNSSASYVDYLYDGKNDNSRYSGIFINGGNDATKNPVRVNIFADKIIVPGTLAVMNSADLTVKGSSAAKEEITANGQVISNSDFKANVWADNVYLGGTTGEGDSANFAADMFIRDDTTVDQKGSSIWINGSYFGYSNSTAADKRTFIPTVAKDADGVNIYQQKVSDDVTENRGHYNSSAIVINGEETTVDLSATKTIYIAGRAYVELSRQKVKDINGKEADMFSTIVKDYKTGESVAIKSTQLAYIPAAYPTDNDSVKDAKYPNTYLVELPSKLQAFYLFTKYFGNSGKVPVVYYTTDVVTNGKTVTKKFCYFDFNYAADKELYAASAGINQTGDSLSKQFIKDYFNYLNWVDAYNSSDNTVVATVPTDIDTNLLEDENAKEYLEDVTSYPDFSVNKITLASAEDASQSVFASGVITTKQADTSLAKSKVNVVTGEAEVSSTLFAGMDAMGNGYKSGTTSKTNLSAANSVNMSTEYLQHYNYLKWSLTDLVSTSDEARFVDSLVDNDKYGEAAITPINKYFNFDVLDGTNNVDTTFGNGYIVKVSNQDITIKDNDDDKMVNGLIITKGDVYFDSNVSSFTGLIVAGGKVYVDSTTPTGECNVTDIKASTLTVNVINACISALKTTDKANEAKTVLKVFKAYANLADGTGNQKEIASSENKVSISQVDYKDYMGYENWTKSVEYDNWYNNRLDN